LSAQFGKRQLTTAAVFDSILDPKGNVVGDHGLVAQQEIHTSNQEVLHGMAVNNCENMVQVHRTILWHTTLEFYYFTGLPIQAASVPFAAVRFMRYSGDTN